MHIAISKSRISARPQDEHPRQSGPPAETQSSSWPALRSSDRDQQLSIQCAQLKSSEWESGQTVSGKRLVGTRGRTSVPTHKRRGRRHARCERSPPPRGPSPCPPLCVGMFIISWRCLPIAIQQAQLSHSLKLPSAWAHSFPACWEGPRGSLTGHRSKRSPTTAVGANPSACTPELRSPRPPDQKY